MTGPTVTEKKLDALTQAHDAAAHQPSPDDMAAARALAKQLIRRDVEHGRSISDIKKGRMGMYYATHQVAVGGWMADKPHSPDFIIVPRVNGREVNFSFRLRDIYHETASELRTARAAEDFTLELIRPAGRRRNLNRGGGE